MLLTFFNELHLERQNLKVSFLCYTCNFNYNIFPTFILLTSIAGNFIVFTLDEEISNGGLPVTKQNI